MDSHSLDFFENYPKGIYKMSFGCPLVGNSLDPFYQGIYEKGLAKISKSQREDFIETPDEFFMKWINTRLGRKPDLAHYLNCPGFDLQMPYIKAAPADNPNSGRLEHLIIASDLAYGDFDKTCVFVVNHIPTKRVLVYSGDKKLIKTPILFGPDKEDYPFESPAPLKAADYTWSLVNISPEEVYISLKKIGFTL